MRKIGDARYTQVLVNDEPDTTSKACHSYTITQSVFDDGKPPISSFQVDIDFQRGPIKEAGVNGCHNEDLLVIVLDRLQGFQDSEFKCRENAIAITKIEEALLWLNKRTRDRQVKGIEGTHIPNIPDGFVLPDGMKYTIYKEMSENIIQVLKIK